ncbi:type II toxin-antitoxin system VapC family toxin [Yinghuangia seranimata]|uniref:type II toxin-antitoxin system VapC family toxin n=1 Tax=Yinghuangia seranimata TaxID=408067 RepID=UPI00248CCCC9|nr:type II toxin-antitoxin system VapC family toxin [Yinghuangia seranimata]MDI2127250.1 type II toxin-antitoxin system VapC family toxin [Yinghuangia seranimata]MDI2132195.1 type II toxin-antitoxin system VapC family toxin [Yinghuangia seranimata]
MIVIDCSALVQMYTDAGAVGASVRSRLAKADMLLAPHLLDVEVMSALLGMARGVRGGVPKLTQPALEAALQAYAALPIRRMEHMPFVGRVRELSANLSTYDAVYVALAEAYNVPLVTTDARIERAGVARCDIETIIAPEQ